VIFPVISFSAYTLEVSDAYALAVARQNWVTDQRGNRDFSVTHRRWLFGFLRNPEIKPRFDPRKPKPQKGNPQPCYGRVLLISSDGIFRKFLRSPLCGKRAFLSQTTDGRCCSTDLQGRGLRVDGEGVVCFRGVHAVGGAGNAGPRGATAFLRNAAEQKKSFKGIDSIKFYFYRTGMSAVPVDQVQRA